MVFAGARWWSMVVARGRWWSLVLNGGRSWWLVVKGGRSWSVLLPCCSHDNGSAVGGFSWRGRSLLVAASGGLQRGGEFGSNFRQDYEYASYNPIAYDLANHFCQMVANYHTDTPHVLDYGIYSGPEEGHKFVRTYLSSSGNEPSETEVEQLANDAEKYTLANHLFWGLWGNISVYVNHIDFDYLEYTKQKFHKYWLKKPILLSTIRSLPFFGD
ncbi:unnamed protein product [Ilex paraguariensis]|uniref:Choline kinase n=1 Tax=Ilex paraguariensis TaxID=185542 RepID=A0ABC8SAJ0_9AQUA